MIGTKGASPEAIIRDIKRKTRRKFTAEETLAECIAMDKIGHADMISDNLEDNGLIKPEEEED